MSKANHCPKCLTGTVSVRDERKYFDPTIGLDGLRKTLEPIAIDWTYTCNKCGYIATNREPIEIELADRMSSSWTNSTVGV
jgi:hypothetical protein